MYPATASRCACVMGRPHLVRRHSTSSARRRPFLAHEVVDLALREPRAEIAAEIRRATSHRRAPASRASRAAAQRRARSPPSICGYLRRSSLSHAARSPSRRSPPGSAALAVHCAFMSGKYGRQIAQRVLGQLAVCRDLAAERRQHGRARRWHRPSARSRASRRRDRTRRRRTAAARRCRSTRCPSRASGWSRYALARSRRYCTSSSAMCGCSYASTGTSVVPISEYCSWYGITNTMRLSAFCRMYACASAVHARHHDVAALHVAHVALARLRRTHEVQHLLDPRPGGVDEARARRLPSSRPSIAAWRFQTPLSRCAPTSLVRTRMSAPRALASSALTTTSRASSTRASEYTKPLRKRCLSPADHGRSTGRRRTILAASCAPRGGRRGRDPSRIIHAGRKCGSCGSTNAAARRGAARCAA